MALRQRYNVGCLGAHSTDNRTDWRPLALKPLQDGWSRHPNQTQAALLTTVEKRTMTGVWTPGARKKSAHLPGIDDVLLLYGTAGVQAQLKQLGQRCRQTAACYECNIIPN
eukprot:1138781-Pelagomonas_calceolata.AAC.2